MQPYLEIASSPRQNSHNSPAPLMYAQYTQKPPEPPAVGELEKFFSLAYEVGLFLFPVYLGLYETLSGNTGGSFRNFIDKLFNDSMTE